MTNDRQQKQRKQGTHWKPGKAEDKNTARPPLKWEPFKTLSNGNVAVEISRAVGATKTLFSLRVIRLPPKGAPADKRPNAHFRPEDLNDVRRALDAAEAVLNGPTISVAEG